MQLNNINGQFARIEKIKIDSNSIVYSIYENSDLGLKVKSEVHTFTSIDIKLFINQLVNITEECYKALQSELLTDFEVSDDSRNWLETDRSVRLVALRKTIDTHLLPINANGDLTPLGQVIERVKVQHFGHYRINESDTTMTIYLNGVDSADAVIITPYVGTEIWIETKITD